jgi:hypothetical protein
LAEPTDQNPPRERRRRVLKGASIVSGVNDSAVQCTVRDMHEHGALLIVPIEAIIPESFLLYVPTDRIGYRATLRWRKHDRCGVSFSGTEPKPPWLYG